MANIALRVNLSAPEPEEGIDSTLIKSFRQENNLSQRELADILGVSVGTIRSWEQDWRRPSNMANKFLRFIMSTKPRITK